MLKHDLSRNLIIRQLINEKNFSEKRLKKIYHSLCKKTHPDLTGKDSQEFLEVQSQYREASQYLSSIKDAFQQKEAANPFKSSRKKLYQALLTYTLAGLHSNKMRIKTELQDRNIQIMKSVIYWAYQYDKKLIALFIEYNRPYFQSFNKWRIEKKIDSARKYFLTGVRWFFDFQKSGSSALKQVAMSYLADAIYELNLIEGDDRLKLSILRLTKWFLKELELPAVYLPKYTHFKQIL